MVEALRAAAAEVGEPLSFDAYQGWRERQDPKPLSAWTIRRHGGWPQACATAGVEAAGRTARRWTVDEHLDAVRVAAGAVGVPLTPTAYRTWRDTCTDATPDLTGYGTPEWLELCRRAGVDGAAQRKR